MQKNADKLIPSNKMIIKPEQKKTEPFTVFIVIFALFVFGYLIYLVFKNTRGIDTSKIQIFSTIFISILMQAFPFMLIGIMISSVMHVFIPDELIVKIFPKKFGLGFLTAMFSGLLFPFCECAIVPVTTRLVKKGVPLPIAITFMLSAPIINPIVIIATLYAFPGNYKIALYRVIFGLLIALLVGLSMYIFVGNKNVLLKGEHVHKSSCDCCGDHDQDHDHHHEHIHHTHRNLSTFEKFSIMFHHAGDEFISVGQFLIIGAFLTSLIKTFTPNSVFENLSSSTALSLVVMMVMAFLFSACSTSDAFIASSFSNKFLIGSLMGFLVFGPMMDIKNILMLFDSFKKSFVIKLTIAIFGLNFIVLYIFQFLFK